jgi:ATP-dependent DNA helicase RecQ
MLDDLLSRELIHRSEGEYPVLSLTAEALRVIQGKERVLLRPQVEPSPPSLPPPAQPAQCVPEGDLFEHLRVLRRRLAVERNMPPFVVFPDRTLREMASRRPTTVEALGQIHGVGDAKLAAYGAQFLAEIASFAGVAVPLVGVPVSTPSPADPGGKKGATIEQTWALLAKGLDVKGIAACRRLQEQTVVGHLEQLILAGRPVAIDALVEPTIRAHLEAIVARAKSGLLRELVDAAEIPVTFEQARLVRAWVRARHGATVEGHLSIPL